MGSVQRAIGWMALFLGASTTTLGAQEEVAGPAERDLLMSFHFNYRYTHADGASPGSDEAEILAGRVGLGWYQNRTHEYGIEFVPTYNRTESGPDTYDFYLGPYYNYNRWTSARTTLFGGPQLGFAYAKVPGASNESAFSYGLHGGMRFWLSNDVSVVFEPRWAVTAFSDTFGGDTSTFDVFVGLSFRL